MQKDIAQKLQDLKDYLKSLGSIAIAFSSGVDSTFLLKVSHDVLGDKAIAITARSSSFPKRERDEALSFCKNEGIRHLELDVDELSIEGFDKNPKNRCYLCKRNLFEKIKSLAKTEGIDTICEGSNMDDMGDYRPGLQAIAELGIKSPLRECNLYKNEIRELSKQLNLATWDKPSFACLASRFAYGETITQKKLSMVERAEQYLFDMGFRQVRVRIHGESLARIEVSKDKLEELFNTREHIIETLKQIGFAYITLDLQGYRTGAMNETLF